MIVVWERLVPSLYSFDFDSLIKGRFLIDTDYLTAESIRLHGRRILCSVERESCDYGWYATRESFAQKQCASTNNAA